MISDLGRHCRMRLHPLATASSNSTTQAQARQHKMQSLPTLERCAKPCISVRSGAGAAHHHLLVLLLVVVVAAVAPTASSTTAPQQLSMWWWSPEEVALGSASEQATFIAEFERRGGGHGSTLYGQASKLLTTQYVRVAMD